MIKDIKMDFPFQISLPITKKKLPIFIAGLLVDKKMYFKLNRLKKKMKDGKDISPEILFMKIDSNYTIEDILEENVKYTYDIKHPLTSD